MHHTNVSGTNKNEIKYEQTLQTAEKIKNIDIRLILN